MVKEACPMKSALVAALIACATLTVAAQEKQSDGFKWFPLQIAFMPQAQLMVKEVPIYGLKLDVWHGINEHVRGVEMGIFGDATDFAGLQIHGANVVQEKTTGLQIGIINRARDASGLAVGGLNQTDSLQKGMAFGAVNVSTEVKGLQLGLFNYCHSMTGVQLGLLNVITEKPMPIMPFMNICW
jgi:hypothetical protein